jgi:hypothetical protein
MCSKNTHHFDFAYNTYLSHHCLLFYHHILLQLFLYPSLLSRYSFSRWHGIALLSKYRQPFDLAIIKLIFFLFFSVLIRTYSTRTTEITFSPSINHITSYHITSTTFPRLNHSWITPDQHEDCTQITSM